MKSIKFSWDENKSNSNLKKHKVSFEEAKTIFYDENAIEFFDLEHSEKEDRFLMLGVSSKLRILLVCYCEENQIQLESFQREKLPKMRKNIIQEKIYEKRI